MTVLNCHTQVPLDDAIWIMRPSKWGNPYRISATMTREQAIEAYRIDLWRRIQSNDISLKELAALHNVNLLCCCVPKPCHGHVLERAVNWAYEYLNK